MHSAYRSIAGQLLFGEIEVSCTNGGSLQAAQHTPVCGVTFGPITSSNPGDMKGTGLTWNGKPSYCGILVTPPLVLKSD